MLKKFSKLLLLLLVFFTISSLSFCYATNAVTTSENEENSEAVITSENENNSETTQNSENGDLYLIDSDVSIDQIIYGNAYIIANNVTITGQIEGNLFVLATNNISLDQSLVGGNIYACADSIYYNGACTYLYAATNNLEMTYDSYVVRDAKIKATNSSIKAAIGRDLDLISNTISLGEDKNIPIVYGNFRYSSPSQITIPEGVTLSPDVVTYTPSHVLSTAVNDEKVQLLFNFLTFITTILVVSILLKFLAPAFNKKLEEEQVSFIKFLKCFGIGILSFIVVTILLVLLLIAQIGLKLSFILILLFALLCSIAIPVFAIVLTNILKPLLKIENKVKYYLVLSLISIIIYGLSIIPIFGIFFTLIITPTSIGLLINILIPHKKLTEEEKQALEEAKKQALEEAKKQAIEYKEEILENKDENNL